MKQILIIGDSIPITPKDCNYIMMLEDKYGKKNIENLSVSGNGIKEIMQLIKKVNMKILYFTLVLLMRLQER